MSNGGVSSRGTAWDRILTHPGFRTGFADVRLGIAWPADDLTGRGQDFRWWYEDGRLFAASHYSRRWKVMPSKRSAVTPALRKAARQAQIGGVWPAHDRAKGETA